MGRAVTAATPLALLLAVLPVLAQLPARPEPPLQPADVAVSVHVTVSHNARTRRFTYHYVLTNGSSARLSVSSFHIPLPCAPIAGVRSPAGWESFVSIDGHMVSWCACSESGIEVPAGWVDDGRGLPSKFQIRPGQTLTGFSIDSPLPPRSGGTFYAEGWLPIPVEGKDFAAGEEPPSRDFPDNLFRGSLSAVPSCKPDAAVRR